MVTINVSTGNEKNGAIAGDADSTVKLLEAMFADPMTKVSMNPKRTMTPGLFTGNFQY